MRRTPDDGDALGAWVQGLLDAMDIPRKLLAELSGIHITTLSRFINGMVKLSGKQLVQIGIAIGVARARRER